MQLHIEKVYWASHSCALRLNNNKNRYMNKSTTPFEKSYWVQPNKLIVGQIPASSQLKDTELKLHKLIQFNVKAVINLMESNERNRNGELFFDYADYLSKNGVLTHSYPIKDLSIPSVKTMESILNCIDEYLLNDKIIYLHCWGGVGRTGTAVGCYLKQQGLADNASIFKQIETLKVNSALSHRNSPETNEQRNFVINWNQH